ncbi:MAG: hypothetical protein KGI89_09195, partial [Euryarchaeota archaeon]|nr:hypothetical protein [Euryarchaeota archaeon]
MARTAPRYLRAFCVLSVAALLTVPGIATGHAPAPRPSSFHPALEEKPPRAPSSAHRIPARLPHMLGHNPALPRASSAGSVSNTLVLLNNTIVGGNFLPKNGANPWDGAPDPADNELFVTDSSSSQVTVVNSGTSALAGALPVGSGPSGILYDASNHEVYVANFGSDNITVFDATTRAVVASVPVGLGPIDLALDTSNGYLYVADYSSYNLTVLNTATNRVVGSIPIVFTPANLAYNPVSGDLYVDGFFGSQVAVVNPTTATVVSTLNAGAGSAGIAVDNVNGETYVANEFSSNLTVITSSNTLGTPVAIVGSTPVDVVYDPVSLDLYVADAFNAVWVITPAGGLLGSVPVGGSPTVACNSVTGTIFATNYYSDNVSVIDSATGKLQATVQIGTGPDGLAFDPTNHDVYVADQAMDTVDVVDPISGRTIASAPVGLPPYSVAFDSTNGDLYVPNWNSNNVSVIDTATNRDVLSITLPGYDGEASEYDGTTNAVWVYDLWLGGIDIISGATNRVVGSIPLPGGSNLGDFAWDPQSGTIYASTTVNGYNNVTVFDQATWSVVAQVPVGISPLGLAYDAAKGEVFVADSGSANVTIINTTTYRTVGSIPVGGSPMAVALDPLNGYLYVTDTVSGSTVVVDTSTDSVVGSVPVGLGPVALLFDPITGNVVVANQFSGSLSYLTPASVTPVLTGVQATPPSRTMATTTVADFVAAPVCAGGACPAGTTYSWSQTHALGTFNTTVSRWVAFTAGSTTGTDTLFVNATLNGVTVQSNPVVVTITGPILSAVGISPSPASVPIGRTVSLLASPSCSGGSCPSGTSYTWTLTNALGTLSGASGNTVTFTAGTQAGTDTLFVNGTLNGVRVQGSPDVITLSAGAALAGVAVSPIAPSVPLGGAVFLSASPSCTGAPCPTTITYAWSLTNTLGQLSSALGSGTTFQAGNLAGQATVFLNASLNGTTRESSALVTILTPSVSLLSVAITPSSTSIGQGGAQTFTATPTCSGSCPSAVSFAWTLNSAFGSLNRTSGTQVNFAAPSSSGDNLLFVVASLNGVEHTAWANITVGSGGGTPTILGVAAPLAYGLLVVIVLLLGILILMIVVGRRRRKLPSTSPTSATADASPPPPPPPPP